MIVVRAPSRLHFGLLSFPVEESAAPRWANYEGEEVVPARRFGGVGLMVEAPGLSMSARPARAWHSEGPLAERALTFARLFAQTVPAGGQEPLHLTVEHAAPEHCGVGTGTQLGLAVAKTLALSWRLSDLDVLELAQRTGRGRRSALGVHGFAHGGFLVDGGKGPATRLSPLVARVPFPKEWRLILVVPAHGKGLHGNEEIKAFEHLRGLRGMESRTGDLCRLVLLGLLPALQERDLEAFGEALYDFNARVGAAFAPVQSGTYASARTAELTSFCRQQGIRGAGQSSWGPTVFAVVGDEDRADFVAARLRGQFGLTAAEVCVTRACNHGAITRSIACDGDHP